MPLKTRGRYLLTSSNQWSEIACQCVDAVSVKLTGNMLWSNGNPEARDGGPTDLFPWHGDFDDVRLMYRLSSWQNIQIALHCLGLLIKSKIEALDTLAKCVEN